jgi:uncharacterized protein YndB with AHSA1/START domain
VRVTTFVDVAPEDAFEVFTAEIDLWWRRGPRFRFGPGAGGTLRFDGGRLVERLDDGGAFDVGAVLVWEPGARLVFELRERAFAPDERTEVEVRFEPRGRGTNVTIEHRGWAALPDDHRARHGLDGQAFTEMIGRFWGDLATAYRLHVAAQAGPNAPGR